MKKLFLTLVLLAVSGMLCANHKIAANGKAEMQIVYKQNQNPAHERYDHVFRRRNTSDFAAKELAKHLKQITGADFKVVEESFYDKSQPAFFIGETDFALKNKINTSSLGQEKWLYKSIGRNIVIAGGFNWGNDIAVYKFLENELNCLWLSYECSHIPARKNLTLPKLDKKGEPSFINRIIYIPPTAQKSTRISQAMYLFMRRNYSNFQRLPQGSTSSYTAIHSFYEFVDPGVYFKTHPEYFGMNEHGKRICGTRKSRSGGQLCLSNPEVRKITEASLRKYIKNDRKKIPRSLWPTTYEISQCDSTDYICLCPECKKISQKYNGDSGLLLHFLNPIAESIAKDYPDITISSYAYVSTEKAPVGIKPAKNISLRWCDLYFNSDCYKPLHHPYNEKQKKILDDWRKTGTAVNSVWDYWNMGGSFMPLPRIETMVDAIAPDLRYFHKQGVKYYLTESEYTYFRVDSNFNELQVWLGLQLLDDITKDEKKLIPLFMKHFYGPAEKPMTEALNMLRKVVSEEKKPVYYINISHNYQTPEFVAAFKKKLLEALGKTKPGSAYYMRIERELLPVLRAQAFFDGLRFGKSKKGIVAEYRKMRESQLKARYTAKELPAVMADLKKEFVKLEFDFPTPDKFKHLPEESIRKFSALDIVGGKKVKDPDSNLDQVVRIGSRDRHKDQIKHANPKYIQKFNFGLHDFPGKKEVLLSIRHLLRTDGKFHWYCIPDFKFSTKTQFFAWGWWTLCDLSKVYVDGSDNRWDVWFSVKATGPAYVPGSKDENDFFLESIILTKPGAVK